MGEIGTVSQPTMPMIVSSAIFPPNEILSALENTGLWCFAARKNVCSMVCEDEMIQGQEVECSGGDDQLKKYGRTPSHTVSSLPTSRPGRVDETPIWEQWTCHSFPDWIWYSRVPRLAVRNIRKWQKRRCNIPYSRPYSLKKRKGLEILDPPEDDNWWDGKFTHFNFNSLFNEIAKSAPKTMADKSFTAKWIFSTNRNEPELWNESGITFQVFSDYFVSFLKEGKILNIFITVRNGFNGMEYIYADDPRRFHVMNLRTTSVGIATSWRISHMQRTWWMKSW